jgi:hypothetical protein
MAQILWNDSNKRKENQTATTEKHSPVYEMLCNKGTVNFTHLLVYNNFFP